MQNAVIVSADEVKAILAQHFGVAEKDVIKMQYSYAIVQGDKK